MWLLALLGLTEAACLLYLHRLSVSQPVDPFVFMIALWIAFTVYMVAVLWVLNRDPVGPPALSIVLGLAAVFRFILWLDPAPLFDNDIYRYLWDAKVFLHGINPYRYAPDAPQLSHLRDTNFYRIGFPYIPTVYPPLGQLFFALSALLATGSLYGLKALAVLADLAVIVLLLCTLRRLNRPLSYLLIYAWHPLPVKEFADSGHLDALAMAFTWLALVLALPDQRSRKADLGAVVSLGCAVLFKLYPILLVPFLFRRVGWRHTIPFLAFIGAAYAPFLWGLPLSQAFAGLMVYGHYWEFNSGVFALLHQGVVLLTGWGLLDSMMAAKVLAGILMLPVGLHLYRSVADPRTDLLYHSACLLALLFLLSPTVDPWYVCAIIPFLCIFPSRSWLFLSGAMILSYGFYIDEGLDPWFRLLEYASFFMLLAGELWLAFRYQLVLRPAR